MRNYRSDSPQIKNLVSVASFYMSYDNFIMEQSKTRYRSKYEEKGANEMDGKNERDEIMELIKP